MSFVPDERVGSTEDEKPVEPEMAAVEEVQLLDQVQDFPGDEHEHPIVPDDNQQVIKTEQHEEVKETGESYENKDRDHQPIEKSVDSNKVVAVETETEKFLKSFTPTNLQEDPLPIKVHRIKISNDDAVGQGIQWASEYLYQNCCPLGLMQYALAVVKDKLSARYHGLDKTDFAESESTKLGTSDLEPLQLMHSVVAVVDKYMSDMKSWLPKDECDQSAGSRVNYEDYNQLSSRRIGIKLLSYYRMKNARRTMEDKITLLPDLDMIFKINTEMSYFAVFDGHNGIEAAAYGSAQLHQFLIKNVQSGMKIPQALQLAFAQTDSAFMAKCNDEQIRSGTTAVVVVITEMKVYIAWAGDCQASIHFDAVKAKQLVSCHKPDREDERERIKRMGGEVFEVNNMYRVNGTLAVTRSIGDPDFKAYVVSNPEIIEIDRLEDAATDYIVMGSDGLYDTMTAGDIGDFLNNVILEKKTQEASELLANEAKCRGSHDNISVAVIFLETPENVRLALSKLSSVRCTEIAGALGKHIDGYNYYAEDGLKEPSAPFVSDLNDEIDSSEDEWSFHGKGSQETESQIVPQPAQLPESHDLKLSIALEHVSINSKTVKQNGTMPPPQAKHVATASVTKAPTKSNAPTKLRPISAMVPQKPKVMAKVISASARSPGEKPTRPVVKAPPQPRPTVAVKLQPASRKPGSTSIVGVPVVMDSKTNVKKTTAPVATVPHSARSIPPQIKKTAPVVAKASKSTVATAATAPPRSTMVSKNVLNKPAPVKPKLDEKVEKVKRIIAKPTQATTTLNSTKPIATIKAPITATTTKVVSGNKAATSGPASARLTGVPPVKKTTTTATALTTKPKSAIPPTAAAPKPPMTSKNVPLKKPASSAAIKLKPEDKMEPGKVGTKVQQNLVKVGNKLPNTLASTKTVKVEKVDTQKPPEKADLVVAPPAVVAGSLIDFGDDNIEPLANAKDIIDTNEVPEISNGIESNEVKFTDLKHKQHVVTNGTHKDDSPIESNKVDDDDDDDEEKVDPFTAAVNKPNEGNLDDQLNLDNEPF